MVIFDSSAVLAFLNGEPGADLVEDRLGDDPVVGAANWSEVAQRIIGAGRDWTLVRALLDSYDMEIEPVGEDDAEWAARRWRPEEGLSLGDRLCLALGERLDAEIWTADTAWGEGGRVNQIR